MREGLEASDIHACNEYLRHNYPKYFGKPSDETSAQIELLDFDALEYVENAMEFIGLNDKLAKLDVA